MHTTTEQLSDDPIARMRAAMEEDDGSPAPLWDPKPGEQLVGRFLRYEERYSPARSEQVRVALVDDIDNDMTWSVWLTRRVLANEFEKQAPRAGDVVGIKYFGKKEGRAGAQAYHLYSVRVDRVPGVLPSEASAPPVVPAPSPTATAARVPVTSDDDLEDLPF